MKKLLGFCLSLCLFLVLSSLCSSQEPYPPSQEPYPPFLAQQEEYLNQLRKDNPKLYNLEKRLLEIQGETQKIIEDYQKAKITREQAKEKLIPLLKEDMQIRNNPDYLVEQRLSMLLLRQFQGEPLR